LNEADVRQLMTVKVGTLQAMVQQAVTDTVSASF